MSIPASEPVRNPDDFCYRHPDRASFIVCQRCGRTVCPECSTQAAVGVHCPECVREARQAAPKRAPRLVTSFRRGSSAPVVSYTLIGTNVVVFLITFLFPSVTNLLVYAPVLTFIEPWTMITSMFAHANIIHIAFNMYSLFVLGPELERMLGRGRFIALYFLAGFGGSVAVLLLNPQGGVLGASGAIFGLLGAHFIIARKLGGNSTQLLIVIGMNLALGFIIPGVSWQAHVGGLVVGSAVAFVLLQTRQRSQFGWQVGGLIAIGIALIAITVGRYLSLVAGF